MPFVPVPVSARFRPVSFHANRSPTDSVFHLHSRRLPLPRPDNLRANQFVRLGKTLARSASEGNRRNALDYPCLRCG